MRIRPYIKNGKKKKETRSKYKPGERPTKEDKLEIKNANRALKKAYRAELKRDLDDYLNGRKGDLDNE